MPWPSKQWQRTWPGKLSRWRVVDLEAERLEPGRHGLHVLDEQRRVRLARRREGLLDADVELGRDAAGGVVRPEPGTAAGPQVGGLLDLGHAQPLDPEAAGDVLAAGGAGDLHVVEPHGELRSSRVLTQRSCVRLIS